MRFAFVAKHRHIWPVSWLCEALDVSRSGFHAWLARPVSAHALVDERLSAEITTSFLTSDRTHGARRPLARHTGRRTELLPSPGGAPHAPERSACQAKASRAAEGRWCRLGHRRQPARPRLPGRSAEPEAAGRLHHHLDRRGLALRRGGAGAVFPAYRRLVHEGRARRPARHGRPDDGALRGGARPTRCFIIRVRAANTAASSSSA